MHPTGLLLVAGGLAVLAAGCRRTESSPGDSVRAVADSVAARDSAATADSARVSAREERDPPCLASRFGLPCRTEPEP